MATPKTAAFELTGADGGPLRGEVRSSAPAAGRPAVVICHGFKGFKDWGMFPPLADRVARAGFSAISFNFSGSGVGPDGETFSEVVRFGRDTFLRQLADLQTVCRAAREGGLTPEFAPPIRLGIVGHSRGGGIAVLHAAADAAIGALVTWAGISHVRRWTPEVVRQWRADGRLDVVNARTGDVLPMFPDIIDEVERYAHNRLDIAGAAARIRVPWLIVHGEEDEAVPVEEGRALARASGGRAELFLVAGTGHTFGARHPWQGSNAALDRVLDRTVDWFSRHLLG